VDRPRKLHLHVKVTMSNKLIVNPINGELTPVPSSAGNVVGPSASTDGDIPLFSGATGKIIKDSGANLRNLGLPLTSGKIPIANAAGVLVKGTLIPGTNMSSISDDGLGNLTLNASGGSGSGGNVDGGSPSSSYGPGQSIDAGGPS
jgi:hypothetical protein